MKYHSTAFFKIQSNLLKEFLMATDMPTSGTAGEKLHWLFEMYDGDGSGELKTLLFTDNFLLKGQLECLRC